MAYKLKLLCNNLYKMKYLFLFFITTLNLIAFGQTTICSTNEQPNFDSDYLKSLCYTDAVLQEAVRKNIKMDQVMVTFSIDENGKVEALEIKRKSKLIAFNEVIEDRKEKIIAHFQSKIDCKKITKGKYAIPFYFNIEYYFN